MQLSSSNIKNKTTRSWTLIPAKLYGMSTMDLKGIAWVGNIYQKFEAMCLEVEETMYEVTPFFYIVYNNPDPHYILRCGIWVI